MNRRDVQWLSGFLFSLLLACPAVAQTNSDPTLPRAFPFSMLHYKYAPQAFDDALMLRLTEHQIGRDQYQYQLPATRRGRYVFVFSEAQVKERVASFASRELLPVYRKYWADISSRMPVRVSFSIEFRIEHMEYVDGAVRRQGSKEFLAFYENLTTGPEGIIKLNKDNLLQLPNLGAREVLRPTPTLYGIYPTTHFAETVIQVSNQVTYLALDKKLVVPALAMDSRAAERLWLPPSCKSSDPSCQEEYRRYTRVFKTQIDLEIEGVDRLRQGWVLRAKLLGTKVVGPKGNVHRTLAAADFQKADNAWDDRAREDRAKDAAKDAASRKAAEDLKKQRELLGRTDVVGIRLGMTLEEAEKVIRSHMKVAVVMVEGLNATGHDMAQNQRKSFHNEGNTETIALFTGGKNETRVMAVVREIKVDEDEKTNILEPLRRKYGTPDSQPKGYHVRWSANQPEHCTLLLDSGHGTMGKVIEGGSIPRPAMPAIYFRTGNLVLNSKDHLPKIADLLKRCGPVVSTRINPRSFLVGLYDLSILSTVLTSPSPEPPLSPSVKPKL